MENVLFVVVCAFPVCGFVSQSITVHEHVLKFQSATMFVLSIKLLKLQQKLLAPKA